ncbi:MAG: hypothetical protein RDU24_04955 [Humidesulfovibrio sp.]|uniref:hypothetical protein n=1 Tax=Humidesulfovibrio sp. TaxID=2910988 RepID=UPI0027F82D58|nr:hypothetical protein [Humidesulfovibrio sp.]MDQ7834710.1 hypothetical protein [Humidesulfovibrio sp.]
MRLMLVATSLCFLLFSGSLALAQQPQARKSAPILSQAERDSICAKARKQALANRMGELSEETCKLLVEEEEMTRRRKAGVPDNEPIGMGMSQKYKF